MAERIGAFIAPVAIAFVTTCTRGGVGPISIAAATSFLWRQQCCRTMFVAPERTILSVAKSIGAIITFVAMAFTARASHRTDADSFAEFTMQVLVRINLCEWYSSMSGNCTCLAKSTSDYQAKAGKRRLI